MYPNTMNTPMPNQFMYGQVQQPYLPQSINYNQTWQPMVSQQPTNQTSTRPQSILGHMITNPDQITPQEIPMDGSISLFPMQDGSAVVGKFWDNNGQLKTIRFIPENVEQTQPQDPFATLNARFDSLEELIRRNQKPYHKNYRKNNQNGSPESVRSDQNAES